MIAASTANAQNRGGYRYTEPFERRAFFVQLGYAWGPSFSKYFDWANNFYRDNFYSTEHIKDFSGGLDFGLGIRNRFSRFFAVEFDFAVHSVTRRQTFLNNNPDIAISAHQQNLDLNVAKFTASLPILLDFSDRQPVVPFVAAGISLFSLRLDHSIVYIVRHTKVALAVNFSAGIEKKIQGKIWADIRGDWTLGTTKMPVSQIIGTPGSFDLSLNTAQLHVGILYTIE
jgi:hypothetical protein